MRKTTIIAAVVGFGLGGLVGASAFFVGNAYQAQMPGFALDLGHGRADFAYSLDFNERCKNVEYVLECFAKLQEE